MFSFARSGHERGRSGQRPEVLAATAGAAAERRIRVFVCDSRSCHSNQGKALLEGLRREIAIRGASAVHFDVHPCRCQGQCEDGPVALAYAGVDAQSPEPPRRAINASRRDPIATFLHCSPGDARQIVEKLLTQLA
jgi:hypothetical protein